MKIIGYKYPDSGRESMKLLLTLFSPAVLLISIKVNLSFSTSPLTFSTEDAISTATPENATERSAEIDENSETEGFQNPRNPRESPPSQPDDVEPDLNGDSSSEE